MSMFDNMMNAGRGIHSLFDDEDPHSASFNGGYTPGVSDIEDALMMQNLQSQPVNPQAGTMFGMPGSPGARPNTVVDEMQAPPQHGMPGFEPPEGGILTNIMKAFGMGM